MKRVYILFVCAMYVYCVHAGPQVPWLCEYRVVYVRYGTLKGFSGLIPKVIVKYVTRLSILEENMTVNHFSTETEYDVVVF